MPVPDAATWRRLRRADHRRGRRGQALHPRRRPRRRVRRAAVRHPPPAARDRRRAPRARGGRGPRRGGRAPVAPLRAGRRPPRHVDPRARRRRPRPRQPGLRRRRDLLPPRDRRRARRSARPSASCRPPGRRWPARWRAPGELAEADEALRAARRLSPADGRRQAALLLQHARIAERAGPRAVDRPLGTAGPARAGRASTTRAAGRCRAPLLSLLAGARQREGRMDDAIALCHEAIAEAQAAGEDAALAQACHILDWALFDSGRAAEATHSARALEIYERLGDLDRQAAVLNNLGGFAYHEGRWDEAVELYRRAAEASARAGDVANAAFGDCNVGEVLADQGHLAQAEQRLRRALRVWRGSSYDWGAAFATGLLGRTADPRGPLRRGARAARGRAGAVPPAAGRAATPARPRLRRRGAGLRRQPAARAAGRRPAGARGRAHRAARAPRPRLRAGPARRPRRAPSARCGSPSTPRASRTRATSWPSRSTRCWRCGGAAGPFTASRAPRRPAGPPRRRRPARPAARSRAGGEDGGLSAQGRIAGSPMPSGMRASM